MRRCSCRRFHGCVTAQARPVGARQGGPGSPPREAGTGPDRGRTRLRNVTVRRGQAVYEGIPFDHNIRPPGSSRSRVEA
ncbi:hypothetical protein FRAHR75_360039 [Frankia sp. Hr75.2]|nr:hypothetical protein FRAHR75_360039 [Frankia sp. Hr75.2]SQD98633.1 hypothetical protein FMEAI12_4840020 [Parafrankia sp. Ea1.12]